jgi:hypothetical protein
MGTVLQILAALLGGGLVTLLFDLVRSRIRASKVREFIKEEITMNVEVMKFSDIQKYPWMSHDTWSSFYKANSIEIVSFSEKDIARKIVRFYGSLKSLRMRDEESREIHELNRRQESQQAENLKKDIGHQKQELRTEMISIGEEIINSDC